MKKILYFDVDNTICNSTKRFVEIYNEVYHQKANWQKCFKWDYSDICPLLEDAETFFAREDFYNDKLKFVDPYMSSIITFLRWEGFEIHFVTIGTKDNLKYKKLWLKKNFPRIPEENYHMLEKTEMGKSEINMQDGILIDDSYINLLTSNAELKICVHKVTGWNKDVEKSGFIRLKNSEELHKYIIKLKKDGAFIG